jgi:hypothetical protein
LGDALQAHDPLVLADHLRREDRYRQAVTEQDEFGKGVTIAGGVCAVVRSIDHVVKLGL